MGLTFVSEKNTLMRRRPQVVEAHEFLEITRDFADPREAIREAISNSIDWGATEIKITIKEDPSRPDNELVIEIIDNGMGLDEERLHAFFDLGRPTERPDGSRTHLPRKIGEKGHGTKTFYNSRQIEVFSDSRECSVYALMDSPLQKLMNNEIPEYKYSVNRKHHRKTYTRVVVCGYNANQNKRDFGHDVLKDYVLWFTRFGSVEKEFEILENRNRILHLQGLGKDRPEDVEFGHRFSRENSNITRLTRTRPGDWTKIFVKRWRFRGRSIVDYPGKFLDFVFYIEGDEAKRSYNNMIRVRGRTPEYGMYKVEDRYGLWVCKDYIPVRRYNEWLGLGKRLETKYHAFVNFQEFRLTANRGDVGNTPPDLLAAIERTVKQIFDEEINRSREYLEYEGAAELEQQYQTAAQERNDFGRRSRRAITKKVCLYKGVELIEPGIEMGVVALFNLVYALEPSLFPFKIVDYDTKRGYDALVTHSTPLDLSRESMSFIEFKYMLTNEFNHSFDHLMGVICWDCNLANGFEVRDISDKPRALRITPAGEQSDYTRYMLISPTERHNVEVFVLKEFLREKLKIEFRARARNE